MVLDNVNCNGNEENLTQCRHNGFGVHECSEDAGVFCSVGMSDMYTNALITVSQYVYALN